MTLGAEMLVSLISTVASVTLTAFAGTIAWYLRGEYREHRKNTAVRRWLVGDPELEEVEDEGYRDDVEERFDQLEDRIAAQHEAQRDDLGELKDLVVRIARQLEGHPDFDFYRGGSSLDQYENDEQAVGGSND